jgi:hypothetical protein
VEAALAGRVVGMYNAEFDVRLMAQSHTRNEMVWVEPFAGQFCIMELFAQYRGEWDERRRKYRWVRLEQAGALCGVELPQAHRAVEDARLTRAILHCLADQGKKDEEQGEQLALF